MQKLPILILVAIIVIVGAIWLLGSDSEPSATVSADPTTSRNQEQLPVNPNASEDNVAADGEVITESAMDEAADLDDVQELPAQEPTETVAGTYTTYTPEKMADAQGDIVLFFKADWCPSCRSLDTDIMSNLSDIPADVTILTVDYDTETALKQKYGITTQHSFVQVDTEGNQIKKWSGSPRLENLIAELN